MTTAFLLATIGNGLSVANVQLALGILLAISEALGADPRVKANGIISFIIIQVQKYLKSKSSQ